MKTILLPFHDENAGSTALDAATLVARKFGSYLEGLLVQETPQLSFGRSRCSKRPRSTPSGRIPSFSRTRWDAVLGPSVVAQTTSAA